MTSDWDVFERARAGEAMAWRELVCTHQSRLTALALFITHSAAAADDVVQETFVRALQARIRHRAGSVSGFLGTIAYRLAVKEAVRDRRQERVGRLEVEDARAGPLDDLLAEERDRRVAAAIENLDDGHRAVLALRFYGRHSYEEIASLLRLPLGTVRSRLFYAVQSCRNELRKEGLLE